MTRIKIIERNGKPAFYLVLADACVTSPASSPPP